MGYESVTVAGGGDGETYGKVIVDMGGDDMYSLCFTEEELVEVGVKRLHARRIVAAAAAVSRTLGTIGGGPATRSARRLDAELGGGDGDGAGSGPRGVVTRKLEPIPSGEGGKGCGVAF